MTDDEKRPGEMIIITPERGADDLGIMLFGQFLGLRRAPGMTVDEALADIERTDPDTAARVRKVGKTLHGILTSSITQATNERDEWKARATQAESDLAAARERVAEMGPLLAALEPECCLGIQDCPGGHCPDDLCCEVRAALTPETP